MILLDDVCNGFPDKKTQTKLIFRL